MSREISDTLKKQFEAVSSSLSRVSCSADAFVRHAKNMPNLIKSEAEIASRAATLAKVEFEKLVKLVHAHEGVDYTPHVLIGQKWRHKEDYSNAGEVALLANGLPDSKHPYTVVIHGSRGAYKAIPLDEFRETYELCDQGGE